MTIPATPPALPLHPGRNFYPDKPHGIGFKQSEYQSEYQSFLRLLITLLWCCCEAPTFAAQGLGLVPSLAVQDEKTLCSSSVGFLPGPARGSVHFVCPREAGAGFGVGFGGGMGLA